MSAIERDFIKENFLDELADLRRRLAVLERLQISTGAADTRYLRRVVSNAAVSSPPPSLTELDEAFGAAATLPNPFIGLLDEGGAGTAVWLCCAVNGKWHVIDLILIT